MKVTYIGKLCKVVVLEEKEAIYGYENMFIIVVFDEKKNH